MRHWLPRLTGYYERSPADDYLWRSGRLGSESKKPVLTQQGRVPALRFHDTAVLKGVPQSEDDAAIAAIGPPLVQEVRRTQRRIRNPEVSSVRSVVKLGAELHRM